MAKRCDLRALLLFDALHALLYTFEVLAIAQ